MTNLPSWLTIPTAGGSSSISTTGLNMSTLYSPNQLVPAEHLNYFLNGLTNNSNVSETALANVISELVTFLTAASITPNSSSTVQVKAALDYLYTNASNLASGTIPSGRIATSSLPDLGVTNAKIADGSVTDAKTGSLTSAAMAAGYKFSYSGLGSFSGAAVLPSIAIGETKIVQMYHLGSGNVTLPASGTYDYFSILGNGAFGTFMAISGGSLVFSVVTAAMIIYYRTA